MLHQYPNIGGGVWDILQPPTFEVGGAEATPFPSGSYAYDTIITFFFLVNLNLFSTICSFITNRVVLKNCPQYKFLVSID